MSKRRPNTPTWADDIETALRNLGGEAHLSKIYEEVERIRKAAGRSVVRRLAQTVQRALQDHSRDSDGFKKPERFEMVDKGTGYYRLAQRRRVT